MMKKTIPILLILILAVGIGAFYGGMKYNQSKNPLSRFSNQNFQNMTPAQRQQLLQRNGTNTRAGANGTNFISGQIISKDNNSLTIKMPDGSSKIVFFSNSTEISKSASGTPDDLTVGTTVSANGSANQDGSITAQSIQIRRNITPPQ